MRSIVVSLLIAAPMGALAGALPLPMPDAGSTALMLVAGCAALFGAKLFRQGK